MGDFNHAQDIFLDSFHQSSPSKWLWLREKPSTTNRRSNELLDLVGLHHPTLRQMARSVTNPTTGLRKGSRIDYTLLGTALRDWIPTTTTSILPDTLGSDHNPISLTKQVPPFTPPPVIINDVLRLNGLEPAQVDTLHSLLDPLSGTVTLFTSLMDQLSSGEVFGHSEILFHAIEPAAREVTNSTPHVRKPSSKKKGPTHLL